MEGATRRETLSLHVTGCKFIQLINAKKEQVLHVLFCFGCEGIAYT